MLKSQVVESIWGNVETSINGYSNLIASCLENMSREQCAVVLRGLRGPDEEVEACDLLEGQTVFWDGKARRIETIEVDSGQILTVEITFEGEEGKYQFTEGDYLTVTNGEEPASEPKVEGVLLTLKDHGDGGEPEYDPNGVNVTIQADQRWIWMGVEGYGEATAEDGHGCPIGLEYYNGRLRLIVYSDINEQDPQIIDMEDARESNRKE